MAASVHRLYTLIAVAVCAVLGALVWALFGVGFLAAFGAALAAVLITTVVAVLRDEPPRPPPKLRRRDGQ